MNRIIRDLMKIANALELFGLYQEATQVDKIVKIAQRKSRAIEVAQAVGAPAGKIGYIDTAAGAPEIAGTLVGKVAPEAGVAIRKMAPAAGEMALGGLGKVSPWVANVARGAAPLVRGVASKAGIVGGAIDAGIGLVHDVPQAYKAYFSGKDPSKVTMHSMGGKGGQYVGTQLANVANRAEMGRVQQQMAGVKDREKQFVATHGMTPQAFIALRKTNPAQAQQIAAAATSKGYRPAGQQVAQRPAAAAHPGYATSTVSVPTQQPVQHRRT